MKTIDLDKMYADMMKGVAAPIPRYDRAVHGLLIEDLCREWDCKHTTAKRLADANTKAGNWERVRVRHNSTVATAYRAKGGAK